MAGGDEADVDLADPNGLVIGDRLARLRAVARFHDGERFRRGQHRVMTAAGMVGVAVGHPGARLRLRRIDPCICGLDIDALAFGLNPGTQSRHWSYIGEPAGEFRAKEESLWVMPIGG